MAGGRIEDTLRVAMLLAACGGFLDGFTYVGHGRVFANAMTGNVVLLGVSAAAGEWEPALSRLRPILAFLAGAAAAQVFRLPPFQRWIPEAPIASLGFQILFLLAGGCFPQGFGGPALVLGISFVAALQSSTFRTARRWSYNSTMTTGNLRVFGEALFQATIGPREPDAGERAGAFFAICVAFLVGASAGSACTAAWGNRALWVVDGLLFALWLRLLAAHRAAR